MSGFVPQPNLRLSRLKGRNVMGIIKELVQDFKKNTTYEKK